MNSAGPLLVIAFAALVNVTHVDGLADDFSNLLIEITGASGTYLADYSIVESEPGAWAFVNVTVPEEEYSLNVLASNGTGADAGQAYPGMVEVSYATGMADDFSNLIVLFISPAGDESPVGYSVVTYDPGSWAIIALDRAPFDGENVIITADLGVLAPPEGEDQPSDGALPDAAEGPEAEPSPGPENVTLPDAPPDPGLPIPGDFAVEAVNETDGTIAYYADLDTLLNETSPNGSSDDGNATPAGPAPARSEEPPSDRPGNPPIRIHGAEGAVSPAEIIFSRNGIELSGDEAALQGGVYDVTVKPDKNLSKVKGARPPPPLEQVKLRGVSIAGGAPPELGLEYLSPNELPFGKSAKQAFAIDPTGLDFTGGEVTARAKGSELYKCAAWDFEERVCEGDWLKMMDIVPGELYTFEIGPEDPAFAEYNSTYGAPRCANSSSPCIANSSLLHSRDSVPFTPEPNQPNTIDSCADGSSGFYMFDESVENITVTDLNGSTFNAGDTVNVSAWVYCYDTFSDNINFLYTSSASSPSWTAVGVTDPCTTLGFTQFNAVFSLDPVPGEHAVRVINQYLGSTSATCGTGSFDDTDDAVFLVNGTEIPQPGDAIIAYRSNTGVFGLNSPKVRFWNATGTWGSAIELASAGSPVRYAAAAWSPLSSKIAVVTQSDDGNLDGYVCMANCSRAGSWSHASNIGNVWSFAPATSSRRFDIAFETASGDLLLVYGVNSASTTTDLAYKVLPANATSFTGLPALAIDDTGHATNIQYSWVRLDSEPGDSEEISLIGFDLTDTDANSWIWNGSAWGNQIDISNAATSTGGFEAIAVRYASDGSAAMAVSGDGTIGNVNTRYWNGSAWSSVSAFDADPNALDALDVRWATLKADPATDDLQAVFVDSGNDLHTAYWNGSAWLVTSNIDTAVDISSARPADFEWDASGSTGRLVWDTDGAGTALSQRACSPQCSGGTSTISTYAGSGGYLAMLRNPSGTGPVRILSARLNSNFDIGSFSFNGSAYSNYGDSAITADTTLSTYESFRIAFNVTNSTPPSIAFVPPTPVNGTVIYVDNAFINATVTDDLAVDSVVLEWNGTNESMSSGGGSVYFSNKTGLSPGIYYYRVWANDSEGNSNVTGMRTLVYGTPPSVTVIDPLGQTFDQNEHVPLVINATDPDGVSVSIAEITYPNGTLVNVTLDAAPPEDTFEIDSLGIVWESENSSIGPSQTCIADIDTTVPGKAYTSLSGDGSPQSDTLCSLVSINAIYGDFDMNISFNITGNTGNDTAINFQIMDSPTSVDASKLAFIALSNWTGLGRNYEVFVDDGTTSGYIATRETNDTSGKFRIARSGTNFSFYTWNNTGSSWILENSSDLNISKALHVAFESESAFPGWGSMDATWDDMSISHEDHTHGVFHDTSLTGTYNVTFIVNDTLGAVNGSETTNFTITPANDPPSTPFILAPAVGSAIFGMFNITWSGVTDEENDSLHFNITLLNPDGTDNATIVSGYGDMNSTSYPWNTSLFPDGNYSLRIEVYENETLEGLSGSDILAGTFLINNSPNDLPLVVVLSPLGESYSDNAPVPLAVNATDTDGIDTAYATLTFPNSTELNITLYPASTGDSFDAGANWSVENSTVGPSQTCIADIDTSVPGKAYTSLSGDGSPQSDALCTLVSARPMFGDFDLNVSFEVLDSTGVDDAINFQVMDIPSSANATRYAFIALSNFSGFGLAYDVFVDDGTTSGYIATRETNDTSGKFRIARSGTNFSFYTWNSTSWILENSSTLNFSSSLFIAMESESAYPGWGTMEASWDDLSIAQDETFSNVFDGGVHAAGLYNVTFFVNDTRGGLNGTEVTDFTVVDTNNPPSKPFVLAPTVGQAVAGLFNITWSGVTDLDGDSLVFNITLLNSDGSDNATIVTDYGNDTSINYGWDTTLYPDGEYSLRVSVYENETAEGFDNSDTLLGTFFINNEAPSVAINSPLGEDYPEQRAVSLSINVTDAHPISSAIAQVTLPNGSLQNVTLGTGQQSDDFEADTIGTGWITEDTSIGPSQNCIADINTSVPGKAYTSLSGDGTPQSDTFCTIISADAVDGDFDMQIDFSIESEAGSDYALNLQLTPGRGFANKSRLMFLSLGNWTGFGRTYDVFVDDGNFSGYLLTRPTDDPSGKMRIRRVGDNFTFYTWNSSASSWTEENVSQNQFNFSRAMYVSFESESAYPGWGGLDVSWDNFTLNGSGSTFGLFNDTTLFGQYNVTFNVSDEPGAINDSETTNFTIVDFDTAPSTPFLLAPFPGELVSGLFNITWSAVNDFDGDSVLFNISLLNPDYSFNDTIVSDYGDISQVAYEWNTTAYTDGVYSMEITVFENETAEGLSNTYTLLGNFTLDNSAPMVQFEPPSEISGTKIGRSDILINVSADDLTLDVISIRLYNSSGDLINESFSTASPFFLNLSNLTDGLYYFNSSAIDALGHENSTETRNVTILTAGCIGQNYAFECGDPVSESCTLNTDLASSGTCFDVVADDTAIDCSGYTLTGDGSGYGVSMSGRVNATLRDCRIFSFSQGIRLSGTNSSLLQNNTASMNDVGLSIDPSYNNTVLANSFYNNSLNGLELVDSHNNTIVNNTAYNNSETGFLLNLSTGNNISGNNVTGNTVNGIRFDDSSSSNSLASNSICLNGLDLNNQGVSNAGAEDSCDSFLNWNESSHFGCTYSCSSIWHRFFGSVNGTLILGHNQTPPYVYSWNASGFNVYFADTDTDVGWYSLQAVGLDTSNVSSSSDFEELDIAFNTSAFSDNINVTYSSDGSSPLQTDNFTVFQRPISFVPVANSTAFNTSFRTGILWDMSDGGTEYSNAFNQSTVWAVKVNSSANDTYGIYDYLIQVPYTLSGYEGSTGSVSIYLELK